MNWKALLICLMILGSTLPGRASYTVTYKEVAMLLRNGEKLSFILTDTAERKLLQLLTRELKDAE